MWISLYFRFKLFIKLKFWSKTNLLSEINYKMTSKKDEAAKKLGPAGDDLMKGNAETENEEEFMMEDDFENLK